MEADKSYLQKFEQEREKELKNEEEKNLKLKNELNDEDKNLKQVENEISSVKHEIGKISKELKTYIECNEFLEALTPKDWLDKQIQKKKI